MLFGQKRFHKQNLCVYPCVCSIVSTVVQYRHFCIPRENEFGEIFLLFCLSYFLSFFFVAEFI